MESKNQILSLAKLFAEAVSLTSQKHCIFKKTPLVSLFSM